MKRNQNTRGFTAVEALIYSAILLIVLTFMVQSVLSIARSHRQAWLNQQVESSGALALEQILREARQADTVVLAESTLDASPGILKLSGSDAAGQPYTLTFALSNGQITMGKNSEAASPLTSSKVTVSSLIFHRNLNANSEAVKVELRLIGALGEQSKAMQLYGSAVLRNSYK